MMYIISGRLRGRRVESPKSKAVRPTAGKTREAIFNILSHGEFAQDGNKLLDNGCNVLDLYCGSGALAFEALSRGATRAFLIDIENAHLDMARHNAEHLGVSSEVTCLRADSSNPPPARTACNLVFIDPPYMSGLAQKTLKNLASSGWLADGAVIVVELNKKEDVSIPEGFEEISTRKYGITKIMLLRWGQ